MTEMNRISDATSLLWRLYGKIRCLGELFDGKDSESYPSESGIVGVSTILTECADSLDRVIDFLEHGKVQAEVVRESFDKGGGLRVADREDDQ